MSTVSKSKRVVFLVRVERDTCIVFVIARYTTFIHFFFWIMMAYIFGGYLQVCRVWEPLKNVVPENPYLALLVLLLTWPATLR